MVRALNRVILGFFRSLWNADNGALKAGDKGAWYADGAERGFCPCHSVPEIDPVGAGDAFCAGLLSGLLDGQPLRDAVTRGAALGAFCVSTFGDYQG